jgi:hypothetical protein
VTEVLDPGDYSVSRPAPWWALSPLDLCGHLLLLEGCHPKGVLKARCGHLLPMMAMRFAEFTARKCTDCHLMSLSDAIIALRRENPDAADGQAGHGAPGHDLVSAVRPGPRHPPRHAMPRQSAG